MDLHTSTGDGRARVIAVLGPTNTGKTHFAMERLLGHETGMIGFPLRLLARENYDRAVRVKGPRQVALITGEEKILPPDARYFLCTVESMPVARRVAFVGVDEIQMCADPDRGHLFTDRLLHARGARETMFMGAETARGPIRRLVPEAEFKSRPRFSTLSYSVPRKVSRLPPRTAIVAFTAADVYTLAELIRRQRGGAAVVLGALSPRTRNAQVAMYQAGEVDYLVATDAIGMGLNMDVDHVAFAATRKFDGRYLRSLTAAELAQIAGRAGRHMNDGTFGTTADIGPLDAEITERIENHRFDPLRTLFWRNDDLRFVSLAALRSSLARPPEQTGLVRAREADDELVLAALAREADIVERAQGTEAVRLLWAVCQIPDFGKVMSEGHARLLGQIYRHLTDDAGRLSTDWVAGQVARLDRTDGDIETLVQRIANIRTWTYVSHHADWLDDAGHWQERTRGIEDKLSDALHERLTQRFVDRRTAALVGRMKDRGELLAAVNSRGEVTVEGHFVGELDGFRFVRGAIEGDEVAVSGARRAIDAAAARALGSEIARRVQQVETEPDESFSLAADGVILWRNAPVARLFAGPDALRPNVEPLASELLGADQRERLRRRLAGWLENHLADRLGSLFAAREAKLTGAARGLAFQVAEALGSLPRRKVAEQITHLSRDDRKALRETGLRIGRESVWVPALVKPAAASLRGLLWAVHAGVPMPPMPPDGRMSVPLDESVPWTFYEVVGYRPLGSLAVRIDIVERLAAKAFALSRAGPFPAGSELVTLCGCGATEIAGVLAALGYRSRETDGGAVFFPAPKKKNKKESRGKPMPRRPRKKAPDIDPDSPFAKLRELATPR